MVSCKGAECEGVYQNNENYFCDITCKPYPFFCFRNDEYFIKFIGSTAFAYPQIACTQIHLTARALLSCNFIIWENGGKKEFKLKQPL